MNFAYQPVPRTSTCTSTTTFPFPNLDLYFYHLRDWETPMRKREITFQLAEFLVAQYTATRMFRIEHPKQLTPGWFTPSGLASKGVKPESRDRTEGFSIQKMNW